MVAQKTFRKLNKPEVLAHVADGRHFIDGVMVQLTVAPKQPGISNSPEEMPLAA
jgi:hypothetical protein